MSERQLHKVGAIARSTGLTVRTLHYYEEIGLLDPAERTAAGHRSYGAEARCADAHRLRSRLGRLAERLDTDTSHDADGIAGLLDVMEEMAMSTVNTGRRIAILVDDVDEHFRHAAAEGAEIRYEPVDQPYGSREYGAVDPEGHLWSFMRLLDDGAGR